MKKKMPMRYAYLLLGLTTSMMIGSLVLFYVVWFRDLSANQMLLVTVASLAIAGLFVLAVRRIASATQNQTD
ncbi:MAG: hypothetical protein M3P30_14315 [Chloroflexota bacterium]|nr:hypothetical protein [Chloroflexota bacterium]